MAAPLQSSMPQFTQLGVNAVVTLEALDPTTGDPVDSVVVSNVDIYADIEDGDGTDIGAAGSFMLVPGPSA